MFAPRYFAHGYFPGRFFPPVVSAAATPPVASGGVHAQLQREAFRLYRLPQRAELRTYEAPDEFGALEARQTEPPAAAFPQVAELRGHVDADEFASVAARARYEAQLEAFVENDELSAIAARRGLPPLAVLTWFLDRME